MVPIIWNAIPVAGEHVPNFGSLSIGFRSDTVKTDVTNPFPVCKISKQD